MDQEAPNYHREFAASPHHVALALLTLGVGLASAHVLGLIAGVTAYVLGWIYLPDMGLFRGWVDGKREAARRAAEAGKVAEFVQRQQALLNSLAPVRRQRYADLAAVCRDIETAGADNPLATATPAGDPRLRKLDELMWTCLRLLSIEQSLQQFLDTEQQENVPVILQEAEAEAARLNAEVDDLKSKGSLPALETRRRFLSSRLERLEVLRKRNQRIEETRSNLDLVVAEQDRLVQQIKLVRADAIATKNAETLTARIDATVEHLDQTNKWLSEMDEFKDLAGDMPNTEMRVGYQAPVACGAPTAPPVIQAAQPFRRRDPIAVRMRR